MPLTVAQSQQLWRIQDRERRKYYAKYVRVWGAYYIEQGRILLENINENQPETYIFNQEEVQKIFVSMYVEVGTNFSELAYTTVKSGLDPQMQVKQVSEETWQIMMAQYARQYGAESIVSIATTGRNEAIKIIQQATGAALEGGLSAFELEQFIDEYIRNEWKITSKYNAERIARTEIISAANQGAFNGAKTTGLNLQKTWLTALDGRERASHAAANNQSRLMNQDFNVGGVMMSKPGDKTAPADEVINCRCGVAYQSVDLLNTPLTDFN